MDLRRYTGDLVERNGIWTTSSRSDRGVSYPSDGHQVCLQVEDDSFWFEHRNNMLLELLTKYYGSGLPFFDIGGGNGFVSMKLQSAGYQTYMLEPGEFGVRQAQKRGVENILWAEFQECGFKDNSLPAVGAFDVVEHIEFDHAFLSAVYRKLEKGGMVFLTVPALRMLWSANDDIAGHYRRYTLASLTETLSKASFKVRYVSYFFSWLVVPILMFRSVPSKLGIINENNLRDKTLGHHKTGSTSIQSVVAKICSWELDRVRKGKIIGLGSSCIAIGEK